MKLWPCPEWDCIRQVENTLLWWNTQKIFFERENSDRFWYLGSATQGYDAARSCWVVTMVTCLFSPRMLILTSRMVWKPLSWRFQWRIWTQSRREHPGTSPLHIPHSNVRQIKINFHLITCCKSWYFVLTNSRMILFWWYFALCCPYFSKPLVTLVWFCDHYNSVIAHYSP